MSRVPRYRIGCPIWSCPQWRGSVYKPNSKRANWLKEYSQVFSTVEGNTTFYAIPDPATVRRWGEETVDGFRFALKFPRIISHEKRLTGCELETDLFLETLDILQDADRLGPSFLQLPPGFGPRQFDCLKNFLHQLPTQFPYALETRHHDFFEPPIENELNELLTELAIDRVIFDSRPLFSQPPVDEIESAAQQRKPKIPIRKNVTGRHPILRLIGRNDLNTVQLWVNEWSLQIRQWMEEGLEPYIFAHTPDDRHAPKFANMISDSDALAGNDKDNRAIRPRFDRHHKPLQKMLF